MKRFLGIGLVMVILGGACSTSSMSSPPTTRPATVTTTSAPNEPDTRTVRVAASILARQVWISSVRSAMHQYLLALVVAGESKPEGGECTLGSSGLLVNCSDWEDGNDEMMRIDRDMDRGIFLCPRYLVQHGCTNYENLLEASVRSIESRYFAWYGD